MSAISVIGLGVMGAALARTLIEHDCQVTVWNRTVEKAAPLVKAGATLAHSVSDAIAASPATIVCVKSHQQTRELLATEPDVLNGKTILEMSTGNASEVEALVAFLQSQGADFLIGMIAAYPTEIGDDEATILTAGPETIWTRYAPTIRILAGKSGYVGARPGALAALFAAQYTVRQGFMFGLIYGALACQKAGVPLDVFADEEMLLNDVRGYLDVFAATVPSDQYSDPPASMATYEAAFDDTLQTFNALGVRSEFPQLMHDLVHCGVEAGHGDKQLTALIKVLGETCPGIPRVTKMGV
jgi:3-hydroxyisobutyrate dehydrogenase-like beta-hydroxyacid dehydrogenase